jgi:hypothetical protein
MSTNTSNRNKDIRHFFGSLMIFGMVIAIMYYLSQYEIPSQNRDILTTLTGMLAASLAMIIAAITGSRPNELEEARKEISSLRMKVEMLVTQKDGLESMLIDMQNQTISRLLIAEDVEGSEGCNCDENECKCSDQ